MHFARRKIQRHDAALYEAVQPPYYCFSKKLENLAAATAMYLAYYNYCWRLRKPGKSGQKRPTPAMAAKLTNHTWTIAELFETVMPAKVAA